MIMGSWILTWLLCSSVDPETHGPEAQDWEALRATLYPAVGSMSVEARLDTTNVLSVQVPSPGGPMTFSLRPQQVPARIRDLEAAVAAAPDSLELRLELGQLLRSSIHQPGLSDRERRRLLVQVDRHSSEIRRLFRSILERRSMDERDLLLRARALEYLHREAEVQTILEDLIAADPPSWRAMAHLARRGFRNALVAATRQFTPQGQQHPTASLQGMGGDSGQDRVEGALALVDRALLLAPEEPSLVELRVDLLLEGLVLDAIAYDFHGDLRQLTPGLEDRIRVLAQDVRRLRELEGTSDEVRRTSLLIEIVGVWAQHVLSLVGTSTWQEVREILQDETVPVFDRLRAAFPHSRVPVDERTAELFEEAETSFRALLADSTTRAEGHFGLLLLSLARADPHGLEQHGSGVVRGIPGFGAWFDFYLGLAALSGGDPRWPTASISEFGPERSDELLDLAESCSPNGMTSYVVATLWARSGRFRDAIRPYRVTLSQSPELEHARLGLGVCLLHAGQIEEAELHLTRVAEDEESGTDLRAIAELSLGSIAAGGSSWHEADRHFKRARLFQPGHPTAARANALSSWLKAQTDGLSREARAELLRDSVRDLQRAMDGYQSFAGQDSPGLPELDYPRLAADCLEAGGRVLAELEALEEPSTATLRIGLEQRIRHYQSRVAVDPDNARFILDQTVLLGRRLAERPGLSSIDHSLLSNIFGYAAQGDEGRSEAILHAELAVETSLGRDPSCLLSLAKQYGTAGRMEDAVDTSSRGIEECRRMWGREVRHTLLVQLLVLRGGLLNRLGRFEESVTTLRSALELGGHVPQALMFLGASLAELREYEEATRIFRRLAEASPDNPRYWDFLATALEQQGSFDEAAEAVAEVARLMPESGKVQEWLERLRHEARRRSESAAGD